MTSSRAGIPEGKSACSRESLFTPPEADARVFPPADLLRPLRGEERLASELERASLPVEAAMEVALERRPDDRLARRLPPLTAAARDEPATPCACRRCAPSAAARVNVRPHSGHVNSLACVCSFATGAFLALAIGAPLSKRSLTTALRRIRIAR